MKQRTSRWDLFCFTLLREDASARLTVNEPKTFSTLKREALEQVLAICRGGLALVHPEHTSRQNFPHFDPCCV
jgi:hypothetical protein